MAPPIKRISADLPALFDTQFDAIIDVRSPAEFADDHVPGAINLPVLDNQQRAEIGTIYKQIDPFTAKRAGAAMVAANIATHLQTVLKDKPRDWRPLVYCWRGGQRSGAMAQIFSDIGWHCSLIDGGYKAYRRAVLDGLTNLPPQLSLVVLSGQTGTAKTHILRSAREQGAKVIDLEGIAHHRGSLLGSEPETPQPSQRLFESRLCQNLHKCPPNQPVFVEAESNKIGNIHVPPAMWAAMLQAPRMRVSAPLPSRVAFLQRDYAHMIDNPDGIMPLLAGLKHRYGAVQLGVWHDMIHSADWDALITSLLETHYDPSYERSGNARQADVHKYLTATTLDADDIYRMADEMIATSPIK
jgi:tRNA 2-selenouridine synthase